MNMCIKINGAIHTGLLMGVALSAAMFFSACSDLPQDIVWLGNSESWNAEENWMPSRVPGIEDVVWIPPVPLLPVIDGEEMFCRGLILTEGTTITVVNGGALYVINPEGDLDNDGIKDIDEVIEGMMDIDMDGRPNFDDTDSDGDGMGDAWERRYGHPFDPYSFPPPESPGHPDSDYDGDGFTNLEEFLAGTDPTDPNDYPRPVPALHLVALLIMLAVILFAAWKVLTRGKGRRAVFLALFLAALFLAVSGHFGIQVVLGTSRFTGAPGQLPTTIVDFDIGHPDSARFHGIPDAVRQTVLGGTVLIDGGSKRPWNGRSTYINRSVTVGTANGHVALGGMRTSFKVVLVGEGAVSAVVLYQGSDHPAPINKHIHAGSETMVCFLGEKLELHAMPGPDWGFLEWQEAALGTTPIVETMVSGYDDLAIAIFSPPGVDLASDWLDPPPPATIKAGDTFTATVYVRNEGQLETAVAAWTDGLFLSSDSQYDETTDLELTMPIARSESLESLDAYTVSFSVVFPDVAPGCYYLLGVVDESGLVDESNKHNNTAATVITVFDANLTQ